MFLRALLDALDAWATHGTEPPASRIPRRSDGALVAFEAWRAQFPCFPGVMVRKGANSLPLYDFGPGFERGLLTKEPPEAVDADGNDVAGVRACGRPMVRAPLGTCAGWNLRPRSFGHGAMREFTGSYIPFPDTGSEAAARRLVDEQLMLEEDIDRVVARARDWVRPLHEVRL